MLRVRGFLLLALTAFAVPARAGWIPFDGATGLSAMVPRPPVVRVRESTPSVLDLDLEVPGVMALPMAVDGRPMDTWVLPGETAVRAPGHPAVPYVARLIGLAGPGASIEVTATGVRRLPGVQIAPAPSQPKRCGSGAFGWSCDGRAYSADADLPAAWARLDSQGIQAGQSVARLVLAPIRYNAAKSEVLVATRLHVRVVLGSGPMSAVAPSIDRVLRATLLNGDVLRSTVDQVPERVLVIANDALVGAVQPLVDWKNAQGLPTALVPLSSVGGTPQLVQSYLKTVYGTPARPSFVVLVGDAAQMPFLKGDDGCASDFMFTLLEGDDLYSDLMVSRISAQKPADVAVQVAKILAYEKTPPPAKVAGWLGTGTVISSSQGEGVSNDDVRGDTVAKMLTDGGYTQVDKLYHSNGTDTAQKISSVITLGRGFVTYFGHGSGTEWATTDPPYSVDLVGGLTNGARTPFILDVSCENGKFDGLQDCLAEAFMKTGTAAAPGGAVGIYSSSTDTAWDQPAEMAIGALEGLLSKGLQRWGEMTQYGRSYLIQETGVDADTQLVLQQYVLFGDASMMLRTRTPKELLVTLPTSIPVGTVELTAHVAIGGTPTRGALVALAKPDDWADARYTDQSGDAKFTVMTKSPGTLGALVTAPDARPATAAIPVQVTGCGVLQVLPAAVACAGSFGVTLWDQDLAGAASSSVQVSTGSGASKALSLAAASAGGAEFHGTLAAAAVGAGDGSLVTFTYSDAGCGGQAKTVVASAGVDCTAPVLSNVKIVEVTSSSAIVLFQTDELATATVTYGLAQPPADGSVSAGFATAHVVRLKGLAKGSTYFLTLEATDGVGNVGSDDNGGASWTIVTPDCTPQCLGKACGDDACGGSCGACEDDQTCGAGECLGGKGCTPKDTPGWPGAKCEACVCANDDFCCTLGKWDDMCSAQCKDNCGGCGGGTPCTADCTGRICGDDGCGGSCGPCPSDQMCVAGQCVGDCAPDCQGKQCGPDGCGASCGWCIQCDGGVSAALCRADGTCATPCCPECKDKDCGDDGCGGTCGSCDSAHVCEGSLCRCLGDCEGKECGTDGCGNSCGAPCAAGLSCNAAGKCVCVPACSGRECGDDGCGGSCGTCQAGTACSSTGLCQLVNGVDDAQAEEVGAGGGGSCAAGGVPGVPAAGWALLGLLVGLALRRRNGPRRAAA